MLQKIKMTLLSFSALFMFAVPMATAGVASALNQTQINDNLCSGSSGDLTGKSKGDCGDQAAGTATKLIATVVNVISIVVGAVAVVMIIIGGFRYVTSGGKDDSVKGAKNTILYALIGLIIVALAQIIVHFVLNKTSSATS